MSHVIIGETPTGIVSLIPNLTQDDISRHEEKLLSKLNKSYADNTISSGGGGKKVRRAFSIPRNPFRLSRRSNKIMEFEGPQNNLSFNDMHDRRSATLSTQQSYDDHVSGGGKKKLFRRSSLRKFITRIAHQMTSVNIGAKHTDTDRVPPLGGYVWPPDQTPGVTGLRNHGNTCFMNAVLQCLSHTDILAEYFVLDLYKADLKKRNKINSKKFGTKGELTEQLALVLKALWTCKYDPEHSTSFKAVVDRYGSQFRSSTQHDAQEFLFWLLDKVHEDLNTANKRKYKTVKNSYGRSDEVIAAETLANHIRCNNSFVQAVFQAQFRSSLACPRCHKQSNTFDPFHCISVQLPQLGHQVTYVTVLYASQHPKQVKLGLGVPIGSPVVALKEQLQGDTGIKLDRMILAEINETGFSRVFCDSHTISSISESDPIFCIETPPPTEDIRNIVLCITNSSRQPRSENVKRFGTPFCLQVSRDVSYTELQKAILRDMAAILKPEIFAYTTPLHEMFKIRLQDPSADPDTYLDKSVEHPLFTEMIDLALSVLPADAGPPHVKLILEWSEPDNFFNDMTDHFVEHESVSQMKAKYSDTTSLTLEQCLEHYTKAETLSAEDAWRCPHCQQYLPVVKTLGLWSLPDILVIHFKRFRQQQLKGTQAAKLTTMVKFPINGFDMSPHLVSVKSSNSDGIESEDGGIESEENWSPWKKSRRKDSSLPRFHKDNRYDLYAVCYHQGDTLETGHYTAACKNPYDHQWYKFDDQKITHVPDEQIPDDIVNNEAYILFYQRRKLDNMECSGTSSTSMDHWVSKIGVNSVPASSSSSVTGIENVEKKVDTEAKMRDIILEVPIAIEEKLLGSTAKKCDKVKDIPIDNNHIEVVVATIKAVTTKDEEVQIVEAVIENHHNEKIPEMFEMDDIITTSNASLDETVSTEKTEIEPIVAVSPEVINLNVISREKINGNIDTHDNDLSLKDLISTFSGIVAGSTNIRSGSNSYRNMDCETIRMIRGSGSLCSKDTLMYIDQQGHSLIDDDDTILGNRAHWISPVTPHKLITVSPKN